MFLLIESISDAPSGSHMGREIADEAMENEDLETNSEEEYFPSSVADQQDTIVEAGMTNFIVPKL